MVTGRKTRKGRKRASAEVSAEVRAQQAVELKIQGHSYEEIAKELGYAGRQGAFEAVKSLLKKSTAEKVGELRKISNARIEAIIAAHMPLATRSGSELVVCLDGKERRRKTKPNVNSADIVLKAIREHRALNGLDMPAQLHVTDKTKAPAYDAILDRLSRIAAAAATGTGDSKPEPEGG